MDSRPLQRLMTLVLVAAMLIGCTGPAVVPTATDTAVPPTEVPPTPTFTATATAVPPTETPTATAVPPTKTRTPKPTDPPTATPTRTKVPKPTNTKAPKPTAQPAATKAPATVPPNSGGVTSVMVKNTFPLSCLIVFWGPADLKLDAAADGSAFSPINPGTYGWRAFIGGAETGEAGNLEVAAGNTCVFICDKEALAIRYGCK
ncbi:hypothetical protein TFLX_04336 [Thermoflexales bacterium]|nr:hypothetical protein TFLX_04336 [Thermoflexales bacterium]